MSYVFPSNNSLILGNENVNVPKILSVIAEVCEGDALSDNQEQFHRLLSIARHIQVRRLAHCMQWLGWVDIYIYTVEPLIKDPQRRGQPL